MSYFRSWALILLFAAPNSSFSDSDEEGVIPHTVESEFGVIVDYRDGQVKIYAEGPPARQLRVFLKKHKQERGKQASDFNCRRDSVWVGGLLKFHTSCEFVIAPSGRVNPALPPGGSLDSGWKVYGPTVKKIEQMYEITLFGEAGRALFSFFAKKDAPLEIQPIEGQSCRSFKHKIENSLFECFQTCSRTDRLDCSCEYSCVVGLTDEGRAVHAISWLATDSTDSTDGSDDPDSEND